MRAFSRRGNGRGLSQDENPFILSVSKGWTLRSKKYLGVHLDNKLDWTLNTDLLYRKGQSLVFLLRRLKSFDVCSEMLQMFYQSVVCW